LINNAARISSRITASAGPAIRELAKHNKSIFGALYFAVVVFAPARWVLR
jgi:hypothetical protein